MIIFKYVVLIAKCSGECVYLKRDGDRGWFWKGEDCLDSNKAYQAYPLCQMTPKQPVESTTQEPLETTRETILLQSLIPFSFLQIAIVFCFSNESE